MIEISIPPLVSEIDDYCFSDCSSLTTISFKDLNRIGMFAFDKCTALKEITIYSKTSVGLNAFRGCPSLTIKYLKENFDDTCG